MGHDTTPPKALSLRCQVWGELDACAPAHHAPPTHALAGRTLRIHARIRMSAECERRCAFLLVLDVQITLQHIKRGVPRYALQDSQRYARIAGRREC